MLKLNRSIVKYYLFENKISNKDLLLIMLIFYYKKTTFYHLKSHGFKISYLKERIQKINKKIGHDFVLVDPTETKKIIRLNVEFENNYLQIPFTYKQLQKLNVNDFKLVIFHLYFYNFKTNKSLPCVYFATVKQLFNTYKNYQKLLSNHKLMSININEHNKIYINGRKELVGLSYKLKFEVDVKKYNFDGSENPEFQEKIKIKKKQLTDKNNNISTNSLQQSIIDYCKEATENFIEISNIISEDVEDLGYVSVNNFLSKNNIEHWNIIIEKHQDKLLEVIC